MSQHTFLTLQGFEVLSFGRLSVLIFFRLIIIIYAIIKHDTQLSHDTIFGKDKDKRFNVLFIYYGGYHSILLNIMRRIPTNRFESEISPKIVLHIVVRLCFRWAPFLVCAFEMKKIKIYIASTIPHRKILYIWKEHRMNDHFGERFTALIVSVADRIPNPFKKNLVIVLGMITDINLIEFCHWRRRPKIKCKTRWIF